METNKTMNAETPWFDVKLKEATAGTIMTAHGIREQHTPEADTLMDMIMLDSMSERCCINPDGFCGSKDDLDLGKMPYSVQYLADNLPAVQFVSQFYLEMIIHGGIKAKDPHNQQKLDEWLQRYNPMGQTNGNVIREALLSSIIYGYSGLRKVGTDLIYIPPQNFKIWELPATMDGRPIPGVKAPIIYEVNMNHEMGIENKEERKDEFAIEGEIYTLAQVVSQNLWKEGVDGSYFIDDEEDGAIVETIYIPDYNFCHLRHSDEGTYGISPLSKDRLRTTLIVDYIKNVTDEVSNDGNDYIMYLKPRGSAGSSLTSSLLSNDASNATLIAAQDPKATKTASDMQMEMARKLAKKLKRTAKTRFGIVRLDWVDRIEKMEGTVQLNNYLSILNDAKGTVADIYGIPAMLAGSSGGGWSTGMSALIDFTLNRTIKPFQQRYAEQLTQMINKCAGTKGEIHFDEIEWTDKQFDAELAKLHAETKKLLAEAKAAEEPTTSTATTKDKTPEEVSKTKADTDKVIAETEKIKKETKLMTKQSVNGTQTSNSTSSSKSKATTKKK